MVKQPSYKYLHQREKVNVIWLILFIDPHNVYVKRGCRVIALDIKLNRLPSVDKYFQHFAVFNTFLLLDFFFGAQTETSLESNTLGVSLQEIQPFLLPYTLFLHYLTWNEGCLTIYIKIINSLRGYLAWRLKASFLEPDCLLSNFALPLISCKIFGKLFNLSVSQCPHL